MNDRGDNVNNCLLRSTKKYIDSVNFDNKKEISTKNSTNNQNIDIMAV